MKLKDYITTADYRLQTLQRELHAEILGRYLWVATRTKLKLLDMLARTKIDLMKLK